MQRPDDAQDAGLPTGEVARRIGVSPVTIRSWERRYGIGPAERRDGRHRRWTPADIDRLEAMCRLTVQGLAPAVAARCVLARRDPAPGADRPPDGGPAGDAVAGLAAAQAARVHARGLVRAAGRLDATAVNDLVEEAVERWGVELAWLEVLTPALRAAGRRWAATGEAAVEVEHLLSWHVSAELRRRALTGDASDPVAVLACAPGEQHSLPLDALAAVLATRGVGFRMLGASVPTEALVRVCRSLEPASVMLWSQSRVTASPQVVSELATALDRARRVSGRGGGLLLGGPGWRSVRTPDRVHRPNSLGGAADHMAALQAFRRGRRPGDAARTMRVAGSRPEADGGGGRTSVEDD